MSGPGPTTGIDARLDSLFPAEAGIPEPHRLVPLQQREWLVDGELRAWNGSLQPVTSPVCLRTGDGVVQAVVGAYPLLGAAEALAALDAACRAWDNGRGEWPTMPVAARLERLAGFVARMRERRDETVRLLMWEIGKSHRDATKEFDRTVAYIEDTLEALRELDRAAGRFEHVDDVYAQVRRSPLGVTLCMGPFNYPLNETCTTLVPALAMGNTVVFKPARYGVLLWRPLLEAFRDSFPRGVVNTVYGDGRTVISPLMASGKVDVLAFIGSASTANLVERQHPRPNRLRRVYGLNAKNPAIVLADADLDEAARECALGALSFNGQRCTALKLLFVHRSVAEAFVGKLVARVAALTCGMPWEDPDLTPLPEDGKAAWMRAYVDDAVKLGARVVNAGGGLERGTFFYPAVVYPVDKRMKLWGEEQFGPVVPVAVFDDPAEPVDWITGSDFGQQVSLFGRDPEAIGRLVDPLANQVCRINLNSQCQRGPDVLPFTGRKDSAVGTLSITDALKVFSIRTLVAAKQTAANTALLREILEKRSSGFLKTDYIF